MLTAGMVILIDNAIIQSHWFQSGLDQAQRQKTGLRLTRSGGFLRHFATGLVRLLLSLTLAFTLAGFADLLIYEADILRKIGEDHRVANAPVFARATASTDKAIALRADEIAEVEAQMKGVRARQAGQELLIAGQKAQIRNRLAALRAELATQHERANQAALDTIAEKTGNRYTPANSGIAGKGNRYDGAVALQGLALGRITAIEAEIGRIERGDGKIELDAAALKNRRDRIAGARDALIDGRLIAITAAALADPAFVPLQDGLVIRLGATQSPPEIGALATVTGRFTTLLTAGSVSVAFIQEASR